MDRHTKGMGLIAIAILTSIVCAVVGGPFGNLPGMVLAAVMNPVMWICLPLGFWLLISAREKGSDHVQFFYKQADGIVFGPYCRSEIRELTSGGTILPDTLISASASGPWSTSSSLMATNSYEAPRIFFYKDDDGTVVGPLTGPEIETATRAEIVKDHTPISLTPAGPWKRASELKRGAELKR